MVGDLLEYKTTAYTDFGCIGKKLNTIYESKGGVTSLYTSSEREEARTLNQRLKRPLLYH